MFPVPSKYGVVFVPSKSSKGLEIRTSMFSIDGVKQFKESLPDADLVAGKEYIVIGAAGPAPEMRGQLFTGQMEVIRSSDQQLEVCSQADFYVV